MTKLYKKSEMAFALVCIGTYCVLQSLANPLNQVIGVNYSASAVFCVLQAVILLRFITKNRLSQQYGLCKSPVPARYFLYYLPLVVLMTRNFWNGVAVNFTLVETICYIICMFCVGFVEEVVFRGLLFKAIAKDNIKTAIIISSVTFGLGHLLNLVNGSGAGIAENLFQVTGAIAIGFLFVILYDRGGSLLPCIITHSAINITSIFANEAGLTVEKRIIFQFVLFAITIVYSFILTKTLPKKQH
ncbi:CPBP family intramembrane metalloprotease [Frisingicoccus caecimuris]|uniref:CAAX prenyl protease 2/Lysostaphin resistance protein A-like domain-containing protein n=1 Tax=Frisingicoccus caecimuris TaxID=1796636 RepID=A0A4R2LPU9_9FIRM|nr:CPBP family intramembrane glutamic endopeptidase [Frisingicoccus caecimuris]MCR1917681.1 CPBP family intramembrane metalloprotease [Frisingicoccus caecimuris]TCO85954.1 hypothetical protein EV212_102272 [Frisingicoccus caecimuris]HAP22195.1 CPBP family intramembrane metalloprotease [Lachnospiraceae bacterium]